MLRNDLHFENELFLFLTIFSLVLPQNERFFLKTIVLLSDVVVFQVLFFSPACQFRSI